MFFVYPRELFFYPTLMFLHAQTFHSVSSFIFQHWTRAAENFFLLTFSSLCMLFVSLTRLKSDEQISLSLICRIQKTWTLLEDRFVLFQRYNDEMSLINSQNILTWIIFFEKLHNFITNWFNEFSQFLSIVMHYRSTQFSFLQMTHPLSFHYKLKLSREIWCLEHKQVIVLHFFIFYFLKLCMALALNVNNLFSIQQHWWHSSY